MKGAAVTTTIFDAYADQVDNERTQAFNTAKASARKPKRSMSISDFKTLSLNGSFYRAAPREDHSYHIKHGLKMGDGSSNKQARNAEFDKHSYMSQVITRAKSSIDPRKYTPQVDWAKKSKERPNLAIPQVKKVTSTD